jgi:RNA polymerase sigma-70 factor (ECF subfamily)
MGDDVAVIQRVLQGDVESFRALVERYQGLLFGFLRNLLSNAADCEDLAQEVFLAAFQNLAAYQPAQARFSTWLLTIARNKCLNLLKKKKSVALPGLPQEIDARTPDTILAEEELFRQLDAVLAALPLEQKTAFVLAEIQGLSYEEIGAIEGISLGTVKSRISRARDKLRALFQPSAEQA